jgi:hypothetical protein
MSEKGLGCVKTFSERCKALQAGLLRVTQTAALNIAFRQNGWGDFGRGITLDNVDAAITYFQSRRRHLVAMFYSIPGMCKGTTKIASHHTLNIFIPQVEMSGISLTGLTAQARD